MMTAASVALACMLAFALVFYSKTLFVRWFRKAYRDIAQKTVPVLPKIASLPSSAPSSTESATQKGYDFEKFVVKKFPREYFTAITWRGDKYVDGIYASSNRDPDLLMEYRDPTRVIRFAVECKWRSGFKNGFIQWAKDYQIQNYFEYQRREQIRVFIVIGIGGTEERPSDLYIIPLSDINSNTVSLHADNIARYRRPHPEKMFFLETKSVTLK